MDLKLELVALPVSDVDRAKEFYVEQVGFNADGDFQVDEKLLALLEEGFADSR